MPPKLICDSTLVYRYKLWVKLFLVLCCKCCKAEICINHSVIEVFIVEIITCSQVAMLELCLTTAAFTENIWGYRMHPLL